MMKRPQNKDREKRRVRKVIQNLYSIVSGVFSVYREGGFEITNMNGDAGELVLGDYSYGKINLRAYSSHFQLEKVVIHQSAKLR